MGANQRFPKMWKTLGVRWPNRHGVTAPLVKSIILQLFLAMIAFICVLCRILIHQSMTCFCLK